MRPVHRDHFENGHFFLCFILPSTRKKMHFIWVSKYFARKYYLGSLFFVSNWRRDRHFTWSSEPREGLPACSAKEVPSFLSYFKTLSIGPAPGIDLATSRSTTKCYSDWANPAEVRLWRFMAPTPKIAGYENNPRVEIFENAGLSFTCGRKKIRLSNTMMSYIIYFARIYY